MMPSGRRLPPPLAAPRAVSAAAAAPWSAPRRAAGVPLSRRPSPGPGSSRLLQALLPLQAAPASCNRQIAEAGGEIQGIRMLKPQGPHSRAQPAHRLRVAHFG